MFSSIGFARLRVVLFLARASTREEQSLAKRGDTFARLRFSSTRRSLFEHVSIFFHPCANFGLKRVHLFYPKKDHIAHHVTSSSLSVM